MTRVYTYFEAVPQINIEDETRLILLWQQSWRAQGWEPLVLNEHVARQHPYFEEYNAAVSKFPTVNPATYDRSCFLRWLAMAQVGGGVMTDYDVACYGQKPPAEGIVKYEPLRIYEDLAPSLVTGTAEVFLEQCKRFAAYVPDEKDVEGTTPHVSDQCILRRQRDTAPETMIVSNWVKLYGSPGWEKSALVHYSNGSMTPRGKIPRWRHIPSLRT